MISSLMWLGLKSPVMPANKYTSDSPTVLLNETESPTSSGMTLLVGFILSRFGSSILDTYGSFRLQLVYGFLIVAQLAEDLFRMLPQFGGQAAKRRRFSVVAYRVGQRPYCSGTRVLEGHYRLVVNDLRVVLDLVEYLVPVLRGLPSDVARQVSVYCLPLAELIFRGPLEERIVL